MRACLPIGHGFTCSECTPGGGGGQTTRALPQASGRMASRPWPSGFPGLRGGRLCLRRNDESGAGMTAGRRVGTPRGPASRGPAGPRSPFDFPQGERPLIRPCLPAHPLWIPACAGMTRWLAKGWGRPAPLLDPGLRRDGGWGVWACWRHGLLVGRSPAAAGRALREAPLHTSRPRTWFPAPYRGTGHAFTGMEAWGLLCWHSRASVGVPAPVSEYGACFAGTTVC